MKIKKEKKTSEKHNKIAMKKFCEFLYSGSGSGEIKLSIE